MFSIPDCRKFTGYKPCEPFKYCPECDHPEPYGTRILLVNLDALGDVLVTTSLLPAIKRKYPNSTIHWLTKKSAMPLLLHNPYLFKVWEWNDENRLILQEMSFDIVFNADKNQNSSAFTNSILAKEKYGFGLNENGAIVPLNESAEYNYRMGLDDNLKFYQNDRTGQDILAETFELPYERDEYVLELSPSEEQMVSQLRRRYGFSQEDFVIGVNTGCSAKFPNKKLTVEQHIELIKMVLTRFPEVKVALLGGREDTRRNAEIKNGLPDSVISTPTEEGLRNGILYEAMCDLIISGDSLGMHIGIGLKKLVVAWFGMTSHQEIDLYDRGEKIVSKVECSPCWSPVCHTGTLECITSLDLGRLVAAIERLYASWRKENKGG